MPTNLIWDINLAWGWTGLDAVEVLDENEFGNLVIQAADGRYWRLRPEELSCTVIADDRKALDMLATDQDFLRDWYMSALVDMAYIRLGVLPEGRKYCLKVPAVLGGEYEPDNLGMNSLSEIIRFSGRIAYEMRDLPDGAQIRFDLAD